MIRMQLVPTKRTLELETSHSISWIAECLRSQVPTLTQCIQSLAQNAGDYGLYRDAECLPCCLSFGATKWLAAARS